MKVKVLFSDLGGVLLTNGWDRHSRAKAVELFGLDAKDYEGRHQLLFGDYEVGKISLKTYLDYSIFYQQRSFSHEDFIAFMYAQSQPIPEMIDFVKQLKKDYGLKVIAISNEGRELTEHRIKTFHLKEFFDFFLVSCFMGIRKPDREVYCKAIDFVQVPPEETAYLEDRLLFVEIAKSIGIQAIHHRDLSTTRSALLNGFGRDA